MPSPRKVEKSETSSIKHPFHESDGAIFLGETRLGILDVGGGFWTLNNQIENIIGFQLAQAFWQQVGAQSGAAIARYVIHSQCPEEERLQECLNFCKAIGIGSFKVKEKRLPDGRLLISVDNTIESWMAGYHKLQSRLPICVYTSGVLAGLADTLESRNDLVCIERACRVRGDESCLFEILPERQTEDIYSAWLDQESELTHPTSLLEIFFDRMPMSTVVLDLEGRVKRFNPTWARFIRHYTDTPRQKITLGMRFYDLIPGTEGVIEPIFNRVRTGETVRQQPLKVVSHGITSYWDAVFSPIIEDGKIENIAIVFTDATTKVQAEEALRESQRTLLTLMSNLPGMVYRSKNDRLYTKEFVSDGCIELTGYKPEDFLDNRKISFSQLIHPDDREITWNNVQEALQQKRPFRLSYRITTASGAEKWVVEHGRGIFSIEGELQALEGFISDNSERMRAFLDMEARVQARTRELSTLLDVSHDVVSTLELQPLLGLILDQLKAVVDFSGATILKLEGNDLSVLAHRGPIPHEEALKVHFSLKTDKVNAEVVASKKPVIINDVLDDTPLAVEFRRTAGQQLGTTFRYIRSWMGIPLLVKGQVTGMLSLDDNRPNHFSTRKAEMVMAFANHVAVAIENARLYQAEQERREVAENLREFLKVLNSNQPLDEILELIVTQAARLMRSDAVAVYRLHEDEDILSIQASQGLDKEITAKMTVQLGKGAVGQAAAQQKPVVITDLDLLLSQDRRNYPDENAVLRRLADNFPGLLAVPLCIKDRVYGGITLYYHQTREFSAEELELAVSFADQAALAIENARQHNLAEEAAAAAERSRLARDLHDAVTQTLFSASLIAEVLPRLWKRNPDDGAKRLEELRTLTRGALAEMRTLLLELRPATMAEVELPDLLRQLVEAIRGRTRIPVALEMEGEGTLPSEVRISLYRIAQEALNNVARHSGASQATIFLEQQDGLAKLTVCDNGRGFDPEAIGADHLGVSIMQERAEAISAQLALITRPGEGTQIEVTWKSSPSKEAA